MEFSQFAFWLLCGLLTIITILAGKFLSAMISEIRGVRLEMSELNSKLAQVVTNQDWHGREILRLEHRVNDLDAQLRDIQLNTGGRE